MPTFVLTVAPAALLVLTAAGGATADDFDSPSGAEPAGAVVTWQSNGGEGNITFFDNGSTFQGTAQFPGEGPVGYRGNS
ncbi:hypothetical protein OG693_00015 [Streptomyces sp. NBC_01259]|uniref:hypothetical protein n=1 Tax=unclassified Streptomyces TaxID=2593676 RepID=UPI00324F5B90